MSRTSRTLGRILLAVGALAGLAGNASAATESIESPFLRVVVNTHPYSFQVIEKSTGQVLLSESNTSLLVADELYPVFDASALAKTADGLRATLALQLAGRSPLPQGAPATVQLSLSFLKPEVLRVVLSYPIAKPPQIREEFYDQGEHVYGIWEYPFGGSLDNRGADHAFLGLRNEPYVHHSSVRAPFYVTSRKYGVYVESTAPGHFSIAQAGKTSFSFDTSELKYDILYGPSYAGVLNAYNALAGPSVMPPLWAFGSIWWRDDEHEDLRDVHNAQEKVIHDADKLRSLRIPASAIWLDRPYASGDQGWGNMDFDSVFPDPAKMVRDLNGRGMQLLVWIANRASGRLYQQGSAKSFLFMGNWPGADVMRPEVYDWFRDQLDSYVRAGVRGYKIDRGDEDEIPRTAENLNAILFPKLAAEGLRKAYGDDYFMFARNANDTARKYTAVWSGDPWNTFAGLQMALRNGLRSGVINFPMWGCDTGGYFAVPDKELFARWFEFSALSPIMEVLIGPKRTVWYDFDPELVGIAQKYASLHHDLIPYTRSYLHEATRTGMPVMRALFLGFPEDETLADKWDEYLYGRDILVAPVMDPGASSRSVYLPAGKWIDYNDRRTVHQGPATVTSKADMATLPLYVRAGAIIPRGDILKANNDWDANWTPKLRIEVFPSKLPSHLDYYNGRDVLGIDVNPSREGNAIGIHVADLGVSGTLEVYCQDVKRVLLNGAPLREGAAYTFDSQSRKLTVPFQGAVVLVIEGARGIF